MYRAGKYKKSKIEEMDSEIARLEAYTHRQNQIIAAHKESEQLYDQAASLEGQGKFADAFDLIKRADELRDAVSSALSSE